MVLVFQFSPFACAKYIAYTYSFFSFSNERAFRFVYLGYICLVTMAASLVDQLMCHNQPINPWNTPALGVVYPPCRVDG